MMREAWILMEASTGEWTADGDNSTMDMFFFLFDDKNCNFGGISTVSNGLVKTSIKYTYHTRGRGAGMIWPEFLPGSH